MTSPADSNPLLGRWRGSLVWTGVVFALAGFLGEEMVGGEHAFEGLLLFGGLFIGMDFERNRVAQPAAAGSSPSADRAGSSARVGSGPSASPGTTSET